MGTVEIFPDQLMVEYGSRTLGGGAGSSIVALNDASDTTYLQALGTLAQTYRAYYRFAEPSLPANAAIRGTQLRIRYSHATRNSTTYEYWAPVTVLVGKPGITAAKPTFDTYHIGERFLLYSTSSFPQQATFPLRVKDGGGKYFLGERKQMLFGRRFWASLQLWRKTAVNLARIYSMSIVINYDERPTVTVVNPSGTEVVARPPVDFDWSDPDGQALHNYDVRIYTQAMANDAKFNIEDMVRWKPLYRRVVISPKPHHDLVSAFGQDNGAYAAFVRAKHVDVWTPGVNYKPPGAPDFLSPLSAWSRSDFTLDIAGPGQPEITAAYNPTIHGIIIDVTGIDNMLPWDVSSFEPTALPNLATSNTTLARSIAQFLHGSASLQMTRNTSTGDAFATYPLYGSAADLAKGIRVTAGTMYTGRASFRANTTSRTVRVTINFFDKDGVQIAATNTQHDNTDVSTGWREASTTATAPAGAVYANIDWRALSAVVGESHFVDQVGLFPGRRNNLLTNNQAQLETDTTGWAAGTNATIARNAGIAHRGVAALQLNKTTSTGTLEAVTPSGTSGFRVFGSRSYTAKAWFTPFDLTTPPRNAVMVIDWYDAAGALLTTATGASFMENATMGVWTSATLTATSHASAAFARVHVQLLSAASTDIHFVDSIGLWPDGASPAPDGGDTEYWNQGGFLYDDTSIHQIELQRYTQLGADGTPDWETIPEPRVVLTPQQQTLRFVDYDNGSNVTATYRAIIESVNPDGDRLNSLFSPQVSATMPVFTSWWLRYPLDPLGAMSMPIWVSEATSETPKPSTVDFPIGATAAVMTHDGSKADNLSMKVFLLDEATYDMWRTLVDAGDTLLLQDIHGNNHYVQAPDGIQYEYLRAQKLVSEPWPVRYARAATVDWVAVEKPRALGSTATHG